MINNDKPSIDFLKSISSYNDLPLQSNKTFFDCKLFQLHLYLEDYEDCNVNLSQIFHSLIIQTIF